MSKAALSRRVFALEVFTQRPRGERFFNTVDGVTFVEVGLCPDERRANGNPMELRAVDYRRGLMGADGTLPDGLPTLTREQIAAIETAGWSVNIVTWQAMT